MRESSSGTLDAIATPSVVRLVWVVKSRAYAKHVVEEELRKELPHGTSLKVDIFVTSSENGADSPLLARSHADYETDESESEEDSIQKERLRRMEVTKQAGTVVLYHSGRPGMANLLEASLDTMADNVGRLAVQTCGPTGMMEDLRDALVKRHGFGKRDVWANEVDLWEDGFVW